MNTRPASLYVRYTSLFCAKSLHTTGIDFGVGDKPRQEPQPIRLPSPSNGLGIVAPGHTHQKILISPCNSPGAAAPTTMEQHILAINPDLRGALVLCTPGRQPALLIEPATPSSYSTPASQAILIEKIWPSIASAEASTTTTTTTRIDKALILITLPSRPLIHSSSTSSSSTAAGAANAQQYALELETLYKNADLGPPVPGPSSSSAVPPPPDRATITRLVQECVSAVTSRPHEEDDGTHEPGPTFFERGMDSAGAVQLARVLRRGLVPWGCPWVVGVSTVYCNPTVAGLAEAVFGAVEG